MKELRIYPSVRGANQERISLLHSHSGGVLNQPVSIISLSTTVQVGFFSFALQMHLI